jgi:hypothetical protein
VMIIAPNKDARQRLSRISFSDEWCCCWGKHIYLSLVLIYVNLVDSLDIVMQEFVFHLLCRDDDAVSQG